ncbi:ABC-2 family transporter protein [Candidatus Curtissbacteria bacterium]|nr:ABC-2 family transporter protein [Candidatus Curtissbacteria bacterium]
MKKYWLIIKNTWSETLTYRLNFVMWRIRVVVQFLTIYFLWLAVLPPNTNFGPYDQKLILTYILGAWFVGAIVFSTRTADIGEAINSGDVSNTLIKPVNFFLYWFSRDLGDKAMNIMFSVVEITLVFLILEPSVFIQTQITFFALAILSIILAVIIYFFISTILGFLGFWTPETWAPRFILFILVGFIAGEIFPLDILPSGVMKFLQFSPFTYLIYFPVKVYLGQLSYPQILGGLTIALAWTILFYLFTKLVWRFGLRFYAAQGR